MNSALCPVIKTQIYTITASIKRHKVAKRSEYNPNSNSNLNGSIVPLPFLCMTITTVLDSARETSFPRVSKLAASFSTLKGQRSSQLFSLVISVPQ